MGTSYFRTPSLSWFWTPLPRWPETMIETPRNGKSRDPGQQALPGKPGSTRRRVGDLTVTRGLRLDSCFRRNDRRAAGFYRANTRFAPTDSATGRAEGRSPSASSSRPPLLKGDQGGLAREVRGGGHSPPQVCTGDSSPETKYVPQGWNRWYCGYFTSRAGGSLDSRGTGTNEFQRRKIR
jgi:hypothetical protein